MSISEVPNLVRDWIKLGLEWGYIWNPVMRPITIPAGGRIQIPSEDYTFTAYEGLLINFAAGFDHPGCGIGIEAGGELDSKDFHSASPLILGGFVNQPFPVVAMVPPQTPPGIYGVVNTKEWAWVDWCKLFIFNKDTTDHRCIGYGYTLAILKEKRPKEPIRALE